MIRTLFVLTLAAVAGWVLGCASDGYSCEKIGAFYVGKHVYACSEKGGV